MKLKKLEHIEDDIYSFRLSDRFGYLDFETNQEYFWILNINVKEKHRGKGHASNLLFEFFKHFNRDGVKIDFGCFTDDGEKLIPVIKRLFNLYKNVISINNENFK